MATRIYNGTANVWSAGAAWVGGVAPTAADDVLIGTGVGGSTTGTLTIDGTSGAPNLCRSVDCTSFTGTISHLALKQLNIGDGTTGICKFVSGMTYAPAATSLIKFVSTSGGVCQITTGTKRVGSWTFDGVGGSWQFQDAVNPIVNSTITLTNGALDTNNQAVGASQGVSFSSSNSNTRSLTLGTTVWKTGILASAWDITIPTGMSLSAASATISSTTATSQTCAFDFGGLVYGTFTSTGLTTAGKVAISGANTFGTLTLSMGSGTKDPAAGYFLAANQTVTGTFTADGFSATIRNFITSDTKGTPRTITAATVAVTQTDFRDITGTGAGSWNLSAITGGSGDCGGNSGITFNTPKNCYMKTAVSVNWSASNWFTTSGGSTPIVPAMPLPQDTAFFDANSVTATLKTITNDQPRLPAMNWSGVTNTPAFATSSNPWEFYGSMTLVSGMTHTGVGAATYCGRGASTFNPGSLTWPASSTFNTDCATGTLTLAAALTSSAPFTMRSGTFALGGFNLQVTNLTSNGGTLSGTGVITTTSGFNVLGGTVTLGGNTVLTGATVTITSGTLNLGTSAFTGASSYTFSGGTIGHSGDAVFDTLTLHYTGGGGGGGGGKILASSIIQGLGVI